MRKNMKAFVMSCIAMIGVACVGVVTNAEQPPSITQVLAALNAASEHGDVWDAKSAITVDVTCDGKADTVVVGHKKDVVLIGVVSSSELKPSIIEFAIGTNSQDAFSGSKVHVGKEPRDCMTGDDIPLDGCKPVRGCSGFRADDDLTDGFHFYWDNDRKALTWWRL
jgi:hypothetical protein